MASPTESGRSSAACLCLLRHDNAAQWALTTFQMEMEDPVEMRHSLLEATWWWRVCHAVALLCRGLAACRAFFTFEKPSLHTEVRRIRCRLAGAESDSPKTTGACATGTQLIYSIHSSRWNLHASSRSPPLSFSHQLPNMPAHTDTLRLTEWIHKLLTSEASDELEQCLDPVQPPGGGVG